MTDQHNDDGEDLLSPAPRSVEERAPDVIWDPTDGKGGLTFTTKANPTLVIHTTETQGLPSYPYPPHLTINLEEPERIWQHVTLDKGAYALKSADLSPNYECGAVYQVEHISYAKDTPNWSDLHYNSLARECVWFNKNKGVPLVFAPVWEDGSAYGSWSGRMSAGEFAEFSGICGHQHVHSPNAHWDPGRLDIPRLKAAIDEIMDNGGAGEEKEMILVEGSSGNAVKSLQRSMNNYSKANKKGWKVEVDGTWGKGSAMTDRLKEIQDGLNLTANGQLDGLTAAYLVGRYDPPDL